LVTVTFSPVVTSRYRNAGSLGEPHD